MYALVNNKKFLLQLCKSTYFGDKLRDLESMALLGKIEQYDPEQEEWTQYMERLQQLFEANNLTGGKKANKRRATFLSVIEPVPYKLLRSILASAKPKKKNYNELVAKLTEHYSFTYTVQGHATLPFQLQVEKSWSQ